MRNPALNEAQHKGLDRLADKDPLAYVFGWHISSTMSGPLVCLGNGEVKVVGNSGRLRDE